MARRRGGDPAQPGRVAARLAQRRRAGDRRAQARDRRHATVRQLTDRRFVDQVGKGRGDERGGRRRRRPGDDPAADRHPRLLSLGPEGVGMVEEEQELVDRRVGADDRDDPLQQLLVTPDQRRVVERVAHRRRVGQQLGERVAGALAERRKRQLRAGGEVGGDPGVPARAGEHGEAAVAARARPGLGQRARELEQLVRVARPCGAGLLDQRPEDAVVAGQRAGVRGGGPGPGGRLSHLQHRDPDLALGAARQRLRELDAIAVGLEEHRDRADAVELADRSQPIARLANRLVAGRDDRVPAGAALRAERVDGDVAALRDHRHRAGLECVDRVTPHPGAGRRPR